MSRSKRLGGSLPRPVSSNAAIFYVTPRWGYDKLRDCAYPATSRHRVTHAHTAPLARQQPLRLRSSPNAFRPLGCSRFTVSLIDSLKCRTVTATPAEPGDLPCWFSQRPFEQLFMLRSEEHTSALQ